MSDPNIEGAYRGRDGVARFYEDLLNAFEVGSEGGLMCRGRVYRSHAKTIAAGEELARA